SDNITKNFLKAQQRLKSWREIKPGRQPEYTKVINIDLGKVVPMVAKPHSPDNVVTVRSLAGKKIDQVCIGSCTNGSYKDMMTAARILKGKKINNNVSLVVAPGSRQVAAMLAQNGAMADMINAGARIMENTCGFCIGNGQAPSTNGISLRTNNRNFKGRSGTQSGKIYLVSPQVAALSALTGKFKDPLQGGKIAVPRISEPSAFLIDDNMIIKPASPKAKTTIYRGPNIGDPPRNKALPSGLSGRVMLKAGDKITTDHIMPAGSKLKYRSNVPEYAKYVFEQLNPAFAEQCLQNKKNNIMNFIIAGYSYGQGSSREHAALCPMYLGVKAVIAKSLERIHTANLINFGIVPLVFADKGDYKRLKKGDQLAFPDIKRQLKHNEKITVLNKSGNFQIKLDYALTPRQKNIIFSGGLLNYTKKINRSKK
ncbi:MAG TPA: aconitase family protein, partial [Spirochaetota bacterium]|nr:aconitase family protein [Spirochaetota bacterium]